MKQEIKPDEKISVIIPAYNEADIIETTLNNLPKKLLNEIIIVNDGSKDNTELIIERYINKFKTKSDSNTIFKSINLSKNRGKGYSVFKGYEKSNGEIIVFVDADLGKSVVELKKLIYPLLKGAEASIGIINIKGGGLGLVSMLADIGLKICSGRTMKAPLSGQRAFRRKALQSILPLAYGFGLEMGLNINMLKKDINFVEIECDFHHRITNKNLSGFLHRGKQFLHILYSIIKFKFNLSG